MDNKRIKRIIAREGIIFLGTYLLSYVFVIVIYILFHIELVGGVLFFYLLYLLIRFVVWAIRVLKDKEK